MEMDWWTPINSEDIEYNPGEYSAALEYVPTPISEDAPSANPGEGRVKLTFTLVFTPPARPPRAQLDTKPVAAKPRLSLPPSLHY